MKTEDELIEAMHAIANEANKSGFSFCAAIMHKENSPITTISCGESVRILGMAEVIKANVNDLNLFMKKQ